jgi:hypothetical protein
MLRQISKGSIRPRGLPKKSRKYQVISVLGGFQKVQKISSYQDERETRGFRRGAGRPRGSRNRSTPSIDSPSTVKFVDGFWSIIVYNDKDYLEPNPYNAYSLNSITAKKSTDGSVAVQFGGCDGKIANCLPTVPDWNYMVRLYRPRPEILNGAWKFPEAQAVQIG